MAKYTPPKGNNNSGNQKPRQSQQRHAPAKAQPSPVKDHSADNKRWEQESLERQRQERVDAQAYQAPQKTEPNKPAYPLVAGTGFMPNGAAVNRPDSEQPNSNQPIIAPPSPEGRPRGYLMNRLVTDGGTGGPHKPLLGGGGAQNSMKPVTAPIQPPAYKNPMVQNGASNSSYRNPNAGNVQISEPILLDNYLSTPNYSERLTNTQLRTVNELMKMYAKDHPEILTDKNKLDNVRQVMVRNVLKPVDTNVRGAMNGMSPLGPNSIPQGFTGNETKQEIVEKLRQLYGWKNGGLLSEPQIQSMAMELYNSYAFGASSGTGGASIDTSKHPKGTLYLKPSYQQGGQVVKFPFRQGGYTEEELRVAGNKARPDLKTTDRYGEKHKVYEGYYLAPDGQYYPVNYAKAAYAIQQMRNAGIRNLTHEQAADPYFMNQFYEGYSEDVDDFIRTFGVKNLWRYDPNWKNAGLKYSNPTTSPRPNNSYSWSHTNNNNGNGGGGYNSGQSGNDESQLRYFSPVVNWTT